MKTRVGLGDWRIVLIAAVVFALLALIGCGGEIIEGSPPVLEEVGTSDAVEAGPEEGTDANQGPWDGPAEEAAVHKAALPQFSIPPGKVQGTQGLEIICSTPGATIYYTLDGNNPTEAGLIYDAPLELKEGTTAQVKAIARAVGWLDSDVASGSYEVVSKPRAEPPSFAPPGGVYYKPQEVSLFCSTAGVEIHYTLNGAEPEGASPIYTSPLEVVQSTVIKAIAIDPNKGYKDSFVVSSKYTIESQTKADAPEFSIPSGVYGTPQTVEITCASENSEIWYTSDGTEPVPGGQSYTTPLVLSSTTTLKAVCGGAAYLPSDVATATYTFLPPTATPTFDPPGGTYGICCTWPPTGMSVSIASSTPEAEVHFTNDGTYPTLSSPHYTEPLLLVNKTQLRAIAFAPAHAPSEMGVAIYDISVPISAAVPTFVPQGGAFCNSVEVSIATTQPSGILIYTTDGSYPKQGNSETYTGPLTLTSTTTLTAVTNAPGFCCSNPASETYTIVACP